LSPSLRNAHGIAINASGVIAVGDTGNERVFRISPSGTVTQLFQSRCRLRNRGLPGVLSCRSIGDRPNSHCESLPESQRRVRFCGNPRHGMLPPNWQANLDLESGAFQSLRNEPLLCPKRAKIEEIERENVRARRT
jgi:hypothetical protein